MTDWEKATIVLLAALVYVLVTLVRSGLLSITVR
jgi:hypothetical protein